MVRSSLRSVGCASGAGAGLIFFNPRAGAAGGFAMTVGGAAGGGLTTTVGRGAAGRGGSAISVGALVETGAAAGITGREADPARSKSASISSTL